LRIQVSDVEVMRNPGMRSGTFAHGCVMTVSPVGVYVFQSYGPRGYTLLQHMEQHHETFPLSFEAAVSIAMTIHTSNPCFDRLFYTPCMRNL
jgi:hypothetical protein